MNRYLESCHARRFLAVVCLVVLAIPTLISGSRVRADGGLWLPLSAIDADGSRVLLWNRGESQPVLLPQDTQLSSFETELVNLVNQARADNGLPPLTLNAALSSAALAHSQDMSTNNFFDHIGSDGSSFVERIIRAGYIGLACGGENIAAGYVSPSAVFSAWMNSSGHRANILNADYSDIGIGYVYEANDSYPDGIGYHHYWTQEFACSYYNSLTPTLAPTWTRTPTRTATPRWTSTSTLSASATLTPTPAPTEVVALIEGVVGLQGRAAKPAACWRAPLAVSLYQQEVLIAGPSLIYTDENGAFILPLVAPGTYDVRVKNGHTLANVKRAVQVLPGLNTISLGVLLEGDASDDNMIDILDFSLLRALFGSDSPRADFNQDGVVDVVDFSLFRAHFGLSGDVAVP